MMRLSWVLLFLFWANQSLAYWSCAWPYRTEVQIQENSGVDQNNYQVKIEVNGSQLTGDYNWSLDGYDLRVVDSDDLTLMDFWVESWDTNNETATVWVRFDTLQAGQNRTIYFYYGNEFADQLANIPFTFVEPGIKFHTRNVSADPDSLSEAESLFNLSDDNNGNYGCTFVTNFTGVDNSTLFGANSNFIAYSETYFKVDAGEEGVWGIRYGSDFGRGGGLYVNETPLEEDWLNNLWWNNSWADPDVLQGTINLGEGYHKLEVIGAEDCCDGGITVQFQKPGGTWQTYSTSNIDIRSRACPITEPTVTFGAHATASCPEPVASYRMDQGPWSNAGDVIDQTGFYPGTMLGAVTSVNDTQVCNGAQVQANNQGANVSAIQTGVNIVDDMGGVGSMAFWVRLNNDWNDGLARKLLDASLVPNGAVSEKYFFLEKQNDGRILLKFEDSADGDFEVVEANAVNRVAGEWYHVTVTYDFPNSLFQIFVGDVIVGNTLVNINGNPPVTSGAIADLNTIQFGDKIPSASLGGTGRSADGTFDEIHLYNSVLTESEIRGLMAKTRLCSSPTLPRACLGTFPDGVNSIKNRTITFQYNAQILDNPDNVLSASTISKNLGATVFTCEFADCLTGDPEVNDVSPGPFQRSNARNDVSIGFMGTGTLGDTTNQYDNVSVGSSGTLVVTEGNYTEFFIDRLDISSNALVDFAPGTYWINVLNVGYQSELQVRSGGPVRLYVNSVSGWSSDVRVNSPSDNVSGRTGEMLMMFYPSVSFGSNLTYSGTLFGKKSMTFGSDSVVYGLVTAEDVTLGSNTTVTYDVNAYYGMSDIDWCDDGVADIAAINVVAPLSAVNCAPAAIDIQILDGGGNVVTTFEGAITLSTNTGHGDWSLDATANGTLQQPVADSGAATYNMVAADNGVVRLFLKNTYPEATTISLETSAVLGGANIDFQAAGFVFSSIGTQVANLASSGHTLTAVETDLVTGACSTLLVNDQTVEMAVECLDPANCAAGVPQVQGASVATNVNGSVNSYSAVTLNFGDATSSTAGFNFSYTEAGQLRLHARYQLLDETGAATGNWISGSSNGFVSTPAGFCITSSDPNWQCSVPGLGSNCSAFKQAGETFNVSVQAKAYVSASTDYCAHGTTQNFSGNVSMSHSLVAPTAVDGGVPGTFNLSVVSLVNGVASTTGVMSEMGVFQLQAGGNAYLGAALPSNSSDNFGRFYPSDFHVTGFTAPVFSDGYTGFTYVGQTLSDGVTGAISYAVVPSITFVARSASGASLNNFRTPLASWPVPTVSAVSSTTGALGSALAVSAGLGSGSFSGPNASQELQYQFNNTDHFAFTREANSLIAPFSNDITLSITNFTDPIDGVGLSSSPFDLAGSGGTIYYGRLNLNNAYGPETAPVPQYLFAEYFDGATFVVNTLDSYSAYDVTNFGVVSVTDVGDASNPLLATDSSANGDPLDSGSLLSGRARFVWSVPGSGRYGTYLVPYGAEPWMTYDWSGAGQEDPRGTVTFGRYRGHDKIIYWKEINY